jgi:hypothetical protein
MQPGGAEREGRDGLAVHPGLAAIGDDTPLDQAEDAVAKHLGVHAEVVLVSELHDHRIRDPGNRQESGSDAHRS